MSEEFDAVGKDNRFFRGCCDAVISQCLENEMDVMFMLFYRVGKDSDIILINGAEFADILSKNIVYISLKSCGGIAKSLGHDESFI